MSKPERRGTHAQHQRENAEIVRRARELLAQGVETTAIATRLGVKQKRLATLLRADGPTKRKPRAARPGPNGQPRFGGNPNLRT